MGPNGFSSGSTTLDGATYTVDNAGNRSSRTPQPTGTASNFTYDALYELTQVTQGANTTESYTYDPVGNRLSSLGISPYSNNTSNELTSIPGTTYTYDYNGNTLTKVVGSNTTTYAWDFENRLSSVTLPGSGGTVSFKYDPFGRRIYKFSSSGTSVYAYDGDRLVEETNSAGGVVARYLQGSNFDEPLAMLRSSATSYYEADGLGSVTSLSNAAGALGQTYTFDSFGKQTASSGSLTNVFQYVGRESDAEAGLYYYRARYYDVTIGKFISQDPISFEGGNNFYAYVLNSPLNLTDPFGLCPQPQNPCPPSGHAPPPGFYWQLGQSADWFSLDGYLLGFRRGGFLDAQVLYGGSQAYANYVFGVFMGAAGFSLSDTLDFANTYGALRSRYPAGTAFDPKYTHIPASNVANITQGLNDARNGTLCNPY